MSIRYNDYDTERGRSSATVDEVAADREISLGTATILGIFLGLAVVCALFFGFGYSMGRRSVPSPLADVDTGVSAPLPENRLAPGSVSGGDVGGYVPPTQRASSGEGTTDGTSGAHAPAGQHVKPAAASTATATDSGASNSVQSVERQQIARAVQQATDSSPVPPKASAVAAAPAVVTGGVGSTYVQVTAISQTHRADADMLVASLRKKGYPAAIHPGAADQLLHVQLGPFATKKDAEAVRTRLGADGYNSILK